MFTKGLVRAYSWLGLLRIRRLDSEIFGDLISQNISFLIYKLILLEDGG